MLHKSKLRQELGLDNVPFKELEETQHRGVPSIETQTQQHEHGQGQIQKTLVCSSAYCWWSGLQLLSKTSVVDLVKPRTTSPAISPQATYTYDFSTGT